MKRKSHLLQNIFVAALTIIMILMSVGFAAYQEQLNITGQTTVAANKWSVHLLEPLDSNIYLGGRDSPIKPPVKVSLDTNKIVANFENVRLDKPGQQYHIFLPIINDGTFDAKVLSFELSGIPEEAYDYMAAEVVEVHGLDCDITQLTCLSSSSTIKQTIPVHRADRWGALPEWAEFVPYVIPANQKFATQAFELVLIYDEKAPAENLPTQDVKLNIAVTVNIEQV